MDKLNVFLLIPFHSDFEDIYETIRQVVGSSGHTLVRIDDLRTTHTTGDIRGAMKKADVIIADVSNANPNVMYEMGYAQSIEKPVITICQKGDKIPFDLNRFPILLYDRNQLHFTLSVQLKSYFQTQNFDQFIISDKIEDIAKNVEVKTVFISYSHADAVYMNRLSVHLRPFEKKGLIDLWVDTKIKVGEKWKEKIESALNKSALSILLISADFLASDFIVDNELPPLLRSAEEQGKLILPVIIKPCRFIRDENLSKFQAINDPIKPLSRMDENDREEVYVKIADYIESFVND